VGFSRELRNECLAARKGIHPWATTAFVRTIRQIEHHDVVSTGIFANDSPDKHPRQWMKQALIPLEEATEEYIVKVTAELHC
jgi:hypothetical protein